MSTVFRIIYPNTSKFKLPTSNMNYRAILYSYEVITNFKYCIMDFTKFNN